jgi:hypothetical protein
MTMAEMLADALLMHKQDYVIAIEAAVSAAILQYAQAIRPPLEQTRIRHACRY